MDGQVAHEMVAVSGRSDAEWFAAKDLEGKTHQLWELEVWLRALERFFRIKNLPLSQPHLKAVIERNFIDELVIAGEGIERARELGHQVLGDERVNLLKFNRYVEESLLRDDERGSYLKLAGHPGTAEWRIASLLESLGALLAVQSHLARLGSLSYFGYKAFGKLLVQSLDAADLFGSLAGSPFRPQVDRVGNARVAGVVKGIPDAFTRHEVARLALQLFRFLRYLDLVRGEFIREGAAKRTLLLFTLVHGEVDVLLRYLKAVVLRRVERGSAAFEVVDGLVFGTGMELKKVFQKELVDFAGLSEREVIYIRMEDSHGILKEAFQQGIVTLLQSFDGSLQGREVFPDFVTKREQSRRLLGDLVGLHATVGAMARAGDFEALFKVTRRIEQFEQSSLRLLMYKDWNDFETFQGEFRACRNLKNFQFVVHRFETFLATLIEEVRKRSVLRGEDDGSDPAGASAR